MFGFAAFSDAGFSSQTTADARHIGTGQAITSAISGGTILGGAIIAATTAGNMTSAVGTTAQSLIFLPSGQTMSIPAVGVTPETRVLVSSAGLISSTVHPFGNELLIKLIAQPTSNLVSTTVASPSLFTWAGVDDNVTDETATWTDVDTEDTSETTNWRNA
jgi:hypothetical protein